MFQQQVQIIFFKSGLQPMAFSWDLWVLFLLNYCHQLWIYKILCFNGFLNLNIILKVVKHF